MSYTYQNVNEEEYRKQIQIERNRYLNCKKLLEEKQRECETLKFELRKYRKKEKIEDFDENSINVFFDMPKETFITMFFSHLKKRFPKLIFNSNPTSKSYKGLYITMQPTDRVFVNDDALLRKSKKLTNELMLLIIKNENIGSMDIVDDESSMKIIGKLNLAINVMFMDKEISKATHISFNYISNFLV